MHKNKKIIAIIIAILVSISMIVPSFTLLFSDQNDSVATTSQSLESRVESLKEALEADPEDSSSRLALANTYYDLGIASFGNSPEKVAEYFNNAVIEYQEVRKTNNTVGIIVDMATAAFYSGQYDLADKTFKEALEVEPNFLVGLVNYGIFLMDAKNDYLGAITQWNTALSKSNPTEEQAKQIESYINFAQQKLTEATGTTTNDENTNSEKTEAE